MDKFQNKYRLQSARQQKWDYRSVGAYFITICTHGRECYFGKITNGKMKLSEVGILADVFWYEIKNHEKNVNLGEFVVMPNHIHGILVLTTDYREPPIVETLHATSLPQPQLQPQPFKNEFMANISPKSGSVSTIIRSYKSVITKHAHRLGFAMEWQERFHDHIIRDGDEYQRISKYISNNPQNWKKDNFFIEDNFFL